MAKPYTAQVYIRPDTLKAVKMASIIRGKKMQEFADSILFRESVKITGAHEASRGLK